MFFKYIQQLLNTLLKPSMGFKGLAAYIFVMISFPMQGEAQQTTVTSNRQGRLYMTFRNPTGKVKFTLAPEDPEVVKRKHFPIIFIDWKNDGKRITQMLNLTKETEFTVDVKPGADTEVVVYGEDGLWKLVCNHQNMRAMHVANARALRHLDIGHNDHGLRYHGFAFSWLSNLQNMEVLKLNNNHLRWFETNTQLNIQEFDASENKLEGLDLRLQTNLSSINLSKNLLTSLQLPPAFKTAPRKVFKGGDAAAYANSENLYEIKDVSKNVIDLTVNKLDIKTLPALPTGDPATIPFLADNYYYTLQERYRLSRNEYSLRQEIDLSSQLKAMGTTGVEKRTTYQWYIEKDATKDEYELIDPSNYIETDGKFMFIKGFGTNKRIFAAMKTEAFNHPLESFERGTANSNTYTTGFSDVLAQPSGAVSTDKDTYFANLNTNNIGDGLKRDLNKRFFRTNTITLNYPNYWYGYVSNDWADPNNWTGGFVPPTLPNEYELLSNKNEANVVFATKANFFDSPAIRDLHTDQARVVHHYENFSENQKALVIQPATSLFIANSASLNNNGSGQYAGLSDHSFRTVIRSEEGKPNGSLLLRKGLSDYKAIVELYAKSTDGHKKKQEASWQYFGVPVYGYAPEKMNADAWIRMYSREKNNNFDEKWEEINKTHPLIPGKAYQITQPAPMVHRFNGSLYLEDVARFVVNGSANPTNYEDMNIFANSYTAAMDIAKIEFTGQVNKEIYLFNTGTRENWKNNGTTNPGVLRGQYTKAIPVGLVGHVSGMPTEIPSMSAFMVRATGTGNLIYKRENLIPNSTENRTPKQPFPSLQIEVESEETYDKLWLVEAEGTTTGYDNGFDGEKLFAAGSAQLYVQQDKKYQVSSVPELSDTQLGFIPGDQVGNYRLRFSLDGMTDRQYYLYDHLTKETLPIADGQLYTFKANVDDPVNRFSIRTKNVSELSEYASPYDIRVDKQRTLSVANHTSEEANVQVYDVSGKLISSFIVPANEQQQNLIENGGVYMIRVTNSQATITERYSLP